MPDKDIMVQIRAAEEARPWGALDALAKAEAEGGADAAWPLREALAELSDSWRETAKLYEQAKGKGFKTAHVDPLRAAAAELDKVIKGLEQPRRAALGQLQQPIAPVGGARTDVPDLDEPPHRFKPGDDRRTCDVVTEGLGCGRFSSHPVHRRTDVPDLTGLDALIADSVAKHAKLDAEGVPDFRGPGDLAEQTQYPQAFPGQASSEEVKAYLAGVIDDLPGEPLRPSSVRDQTAPSPDDLLCAACQYAAPAPGKAICADCSLLDDQTLAAMIGRTAHAVRPPPEYEPLDGGLGSRVGGPTGVDLRATEIYTEPGPGQWSAPGDAHAGALVSIPAGALAEGTVMHLSATGILSDPARNFAREILESHPVTMPAVPPVPLLGQPGDAGRGYDHTYVPPGAVPFSFTELLTAVPMAALPVHLSHSQIETVGDCPAKYRMQRLPRDERVDQRLLPVEQIPQWAPIGGSAFHAVVEALERLMINDGDLGKLSVHRDAVPVGDGFIPGRWDLDCEQSWRTYFEAECRKIEATSPVPRTRWRASKQGTEGETWWNVNGPLMLSFYLAARPGEDTMLMPSAPNTVADVPAIEIERIVEVPTPYGNLPYKAVLDRVTVRGGEPGQIPVLVIRDYKTGATMPGDAQQLGEYANVLRLLGVPPQVKIVGTFFNARKGTWTPEVDLTAAWPMEWFTYLVTTGHAQKLALTQGPTPARPSSFCGGCSVRYACPVKNAGRATATS